MGVSVGLGANELQDANVMTITESNIALPIVFIYFLTFVLMFYDKHPTPCAVDSGPRGLCLGADKTRSPKMPKNGGESPKQFMLL